MSGGVWREDVGRASAECWTDKPQQSVNYVEAHDNLTLYDKLRSSMPEASGAEIIAADKLAAAIVFLSQGVPFIQAGQEILRSKTAPDGSFVHDSYNSPDSVNSIKWNDVTLRRSVMEYYRGLIAVRKFFPQFRMRDAESIRKIRFETLEGGAGRCGFWRSAADSESGGSPAEVRKRKAHDGIRGSYHRRNSSAVHCRRRGERGSEGHHSCGVPVRRAYGLHIQNAGRGSSTCGSAL